MPVSVKLTFLLKIMINDKGYFLSKHLAQNWNLLKVFLNPSLKNLKCVHTMLVYTSLSKQNLSKKNPKENLTVFILFPSRWFAVLWLSMLTIFCAWISVEQRAVKAWGWWGQRSVGNIAMSWQIHDKENVLHSCTHLFLKILSYLGDQ